MGLGARVLIEAISRVPIKILLIFVNHYNAIWRIFGN